mmetsp:Transcript_63823/g.152223  ORF Transcript_63823/g.152223 Transcript_63823/m.152223 type:complete len:202 (-) Transcript_63823:28-633(-)
MSVFSIPIFSVTEEAEQLEHAPCNSNLTMDPSMSTTLQSPPSLCRYGRSSSRTISTFSGVRGNLGFSLESLSPEDSLESDSSKGECMSSSVAVAAGAEPDASALRTSLERRARFIGCREASCRHLDHLVAMASAEHVAPAQRFAKAALPSEVEVHRNSCRWSPGLAVAVNLGGTGRLNASASLAILHKCLKLAQALPLYLL